jgi:hypothetical protein
MVPAPRKVNLRLEGLDGATMRIAELSREDGRSFTIDAGPDAATSLKVFVTRHGDAASATSFLFIAEDSEHRERSIYKAAFNSPGETK